MRTKPRDLPSGGDFDVFISVGGEDAGEAEIVADSLRKKNLSPFFYKQTMYGSDFLRVIDDVLDATNCLVAVGTRLENLKREYVAYEYRSFFHDMLLGLKPDAQLLSFIAGFDPRDLPKPLRHHHQIVYDLNSREPGLEDLGRQISENR